MLRAAGASGTGSSTRRRTSRRCATSTRRSRTSRSSPCEDDAAIVDAIDERTLLVPISHVLFKNGEIQDVEPIVRRAHEAGAHVILDCYQSAGIVPVRPHRARRRLRRRRQREVALRRAGRRLALRASGSRGTARADARRLAGARAAVRVRARARVRGAARGASSPARRTCPRSTRRRAGYDVIEEVGVPAIRERSLALTQLLDRPVRRRRSRGSSRRARPSAGAALSPSRRPTTPPCHAELGERGIVCDFRPDPVGGIRLGAHFFNSEDEVTARGRGARRHRGNRRVRTPPGSSCPFLGLGDSSGRPMNWSCGGCSCSSSWSSR